MADMKFGIRVEGLEQLRAVERGLGVLASQARDVSAKALNDVAFAVQEEMRQELRRVFDRPTPYIANSPKVAKASASSLQAFVAPTAGRADRLPTTGSKAGVDPQQILQAQTFGTARADKKSEVLLRRWGYLPRGYQTVLPAVPFPGSEDGHGNIRGPFLQQVLSYLQLYYLEGAGANMTAQSRANVRRYGRAKAPGVRTQRKHAMQPFLGRHYFISQGRYRDQTAHLPMGIFASVGVGKNKQVKAVLLFAKVRRYQRRLDLDALVQRMNTAEMLERRVRYWTYTALEKAGLR
jgi:hypothetical protein